MSLASRTSWSQNVISISLTVYFCWEYIVKYYALVLVSKLKDFAAWVYSYKTVFHHFQPRLLGKQNLINKTKITFSLMSLASRTSWSQNVISISLTVYFCSEYKLLNTMPYFLSWKYLPLSVRPSWHELNHGLPQNLCVY